MVESTKSEVSLSFNLKTDSRKITTQCSVRSHLPTQKSFSALQPEGFNPKKSLQRLGNKSAAKRTAIRSTKKNPIANWFSRKWTPQHAIVSLSMLHVSASHHDNTTTTIKLLPGKTVINFVPFRCQSNVTTNTGIITPVDLTYIQTWYLESGESSCLP